MFINSIRRTTRQWKPRTINHSIKRFSTTSSSSHSHYPHLSSKYNVAVAFQPKERDENKLINEHFKMKTPISPSGEDNLFVSKRDNNEIAVGVADGVGGWAELGFDSSAISRELCNTMGSLFASAEKQSLAFDPKYLLDQAFTKIVNENLVEVGGTTACLGVFKPDGNVQVANLGDSWCGVFRNSKLILETKIQTHAFNTPYQLAIVPEAIMKRENARFIMDKPSSADVYNFKVQKGDIILFATDGVIDNIEVGDIEIFLKDNVDTELDILAKDFVLKVNRLSLDETFPSVFSQELSKMTGRNYSGGKEDDITTVFVKVIK